MSRIPAVAASPLSTSSSCRPLRVAIFGFGTVGSSVARILIESAPAGLELTQIVNRNVDRKRVNWVPSSVRWTDDPASVLEAAPDSLAAADVIVELAGGLEPAGEWVRKALSAGKSVVTANKKLIAYHGLELEALAASKGAHLLYGAACGGWDSGNSRSGTRAGGGPGGAGRGHFEWHLQLYPQQNGGWC